MIISCFPSITSWNIRNISSRKFIFLVCFSVFFIFCNSSEKLPSHFSLFCLKVTLQPASCIFFFYQGLPLIKVSALYQAEISGGGFYIPFLLSITFARVLRTKGQSSFFLSTVLQVVLTWLNSFVKKMRLCQGVI